jgi:hypothetical protein
VFIFRILGMLGNLDSPFTQQIHVAPSNTRRQTIERESWGKIRFHRVFPDGHAQFWSMYCITLGVKDKKEEFFVP